METCEWALHEAVVEAHVAVKISSLRGARDMAHLSRKDGSLDLHLSGRENMDWVWKAHWVGLSHSWSSDDAIKCPRHFTKSLMIQRLFFRVKGFCFGPFFPLYSIPPFFMEPSFSDYCSLGVCNFL